jgi:hypothetical protein
MKTKRYGYATCLPLALSVRGEERCKVLACFHVVVKMYRYFLEERLFIVKTYWITGSIQNCQRRFVEQIGGRNPPSKRCIQLLVKKLIISYLLVLPTFFLRILKTHNRTSLKVWMQMYCTFVLFVNQDFPGLPASGTHCIMLLFTPKILKSSIKVYRLESRINLSCILNVPTSINRHISLTFWRPNVF